MANANLNSAKVAKNDEFYTQYQDIQDEINTYVEYDSEVFRDKTILLPCDDPEWSNFTKFFAQNFGKLGLKKLISTSYAIESKNIQLDWQPTLFEMESPCFSEDKSRVKGKIFRLTRGLNEDVSVDINDLQWEYMEGDGDFRSEEVKKLRDEADIIITNPPFSLFREFLSWIFESRKKFLIIGNMNCITYKEVFPLIKNNELWLGNGFTKGNAYFKVIREDLREYSSSFYDKSTGFVKFGNVRWFTNLDHGRRHERLSLMSMEDNIKFNKKLKGKAYQKYDNYDAIEVPFTDAIPNDYFESMAVPISYFDKHNPEEFEIIDANSIRRCELVPMKTHGLIKDKEAVITEGESSDKYLTSNDNSAIIVYNTTQHNTTQHNTTQHNTTQHNTTQHNTHHVCKACYQEKADVVDSWECQSHSSTDTTQSSLRSQDSTAICKTIQGMDTDSRLEEKRHMPASSSSTEVSCSGVMGVPVSFLDKYCPEQFEIVGLANSARYLGSFPCLTIINGRNIYNRLLIKHKQV